MGILEELFFSGGAILGERMCGRDKGRRGEGETGCVEEIYQLRYE